MYDVLISGSHGSREQYAQRGERAHYSNLLHATRRRAPRSRCRRPRHIQPGLCHRNPPSNSWWPIETRPCAHSPSPRDTSTTPTTRPPSALPTSRSPWKTPLRHALLYSALSNSNKAPHPVGERAPRPRPHHHHPHPPRPPRPGPRAPRPPSAPRPRPGPLPAMRPPPRPPSSTRRTSSPSSGACAPAAPRATTRSSSSKSLARTARSRRRTARCAALPCLERLSVPPSLSRGLTLFVPLAARCTRSISSP